jgi:hypothetical protein
LAFEAFAVFAEAFEDDFFAAALFAAGFAFEPLPPDFEADFALDAFALEPDFAAGFFAAVADFFADFFAIILESLF